MEAPFVAFASATETPVEQPVRELEQPFVGQWNTLVSTTNWEKGRIIAAWRDTLIAVGASALEYSDDCWSRRVGAVTGQHVGRLRRVYQRFGQVQANYAGLCWSHFQAALDWNDAEMWLEGAVQNEWSVTEMRRTRWETLGSLPTEEPRVTDIVPAEHDEDFVSTRDRYDGSETASIHDGPLIPEGPDFGEEPADRDSDGAKIYADSDREAIPFIRPFANLAELPPDLADAFEAFKLALLRHKAEGWRQITRDDALASLDALKELALAPTSDERVF